MAATPVFLPQKFHGQRNLAGYSPEGRKESDTTEHMLNILLPYLTNQLQSLHIILCHSEYIQKVDCMLALIQPDPLQPLERLQFLFKLKPVNRCTSHPDFEDSVGFWPTASCLLKTTLSPSPQTCSKGLKSDLRWSASLSPGRKQRPGRVWTEFCLWDRRLLSPSGKRKSRSRDLRHFKNLCHCL